MSSKLTDYHRDVLRLVARSEDEGEGWRRVSDMLWPTIQKWAADMPELLELGDQRVRLTREALTLLKWT